MPQIHVLVVADPVAADLVAGALSAAGYVVGVAFTGHEGLQRASDDEPDIVILDLELRDIPGLDVCCGLRRWYANPIIALSADGSDGEIIRALDSGADDYLTKPFSVPEFLARLRVRSAIGRRSRWRRRLPSPSATSSSTPRRSPHW